MASWQSRVFRLMLNRNRRNKPTWDFNTSVLAFREQCEAGAARFGKVPSGIEVKPVMIEGRRAEWICPTGTALDKVIFWIHGGRVHIRFLLGSPESCG